MSIGNRMSGEAEPKLDEPTGLGTDATQTDGDLVLDAPGGAAFRSTRTAGHPGNHR